MPRLDDLAVERWGLVLERAPDAVAGEPNTLAVPVLGVFVRHIATSAWIKGLNGFHVRHMWRLRIGLKPCAHRGCVGVAVEIAQITVEGVLEHLERVALGGRVVVEADRPRPDLEAL